MSGRTALERRYRRLLAWYPRAFRAESGEELIAVLMAAARAGQTWPDAEEAANLIANGLWMRLRPSAPRSARALRAAVALMFAGAATTAVSLVLVIASLPLAASREPRLRLLGHQQPAGVAIAAGTVGAVCMIALWLWMAWAVGHGRRWGRTGSCILFLVATLRLFAGNGPAVHAFAGLTWLLGLSAVWLLWRPTSRAFLDSRGRRAA